MSVVSVAYEDGIAVITVSNPPVNTIDAAVRTGLSQVIGEIEARLGASVTMPLAQGLEYETELVNGAKATVESKALVHVFFAERETRKVPGLPEVTRPRPVKLAAIARQRGPEPRAVLLRSGRKPVPDRCKIAPFQRFLPELQ